MAFRGFIWGTIICVPFWLIVILLVKPGDIAMETIISVGLALSGLLLFLILASLKKKPEWTRHTATQSENKAPPFI